jgi:hypothetical protein
MRRAAVSHQQRVHRIAEHAVHLADAAEPTPTRAGQLRWAARGDQRVVHDAMQVVMANAKVDLTQRGAAIMLLQIAMEQTQTGATS